MKFIAERRREKQKMKRSLEERIDRIQNSVGINDFDELKELKQWTYKMRKTKKLQGSGWQGMVSKERNQGGSSVR